MYSNENSKSCWDQKGRRKQNFCASFYCWVLSQPDSKTTSSKLSEWYMWAVSQDKKAKICYVSKEKKGLGAAQSQPQLEGFWRYDQVYSLGRPVRMVQMPRKKTISNKPVLNLYQIPLPNWHFIDQNFHKIWVSKVMFLRTMGIILGVILAPKTKILELFDGFGLQSYQAFLRCAIILKDLGVNRTPRLCTMRCVGAYVGILQSWHED